MVLFVKDYLIYIANTYGLIQEVYSVPVLSPNHLVKQNEQNTWQLCSI